MAIEFSRNITFGQYLNLGSPIDRLDPRSKIISTWLLIFAALLVNSYLGMGLLALCILLILLVARIPLGYTWRGMRLLLIAAGVFFVFQVLFHPNPAPETTWWRWGYISLSLDGLAFAGLMFLRVVLLYLLISTLMFTTSMMDLADGVEIMFDPLKRIGLPINELVMVMVIVLKFVPLLVGEIERLLKAQAARGSSIDSGSLKERAQSLGAILVPIFINALQRAEVVATAMEARCYRGGKGRTKRRVLRFGRNDAIAMLIVLLFVAAILVLRFS
jgi:ABC-type cobalt transport system, permease component CbiQ and related transporters